MRGALTTQCQCLRAQLNVSVEAARARLAKIILSLIPDTKDPAEIQAIAVREMTMGSA